MLEVSVLNASQKRYGTGSIAGFQQGDTAAAGAAVFQAAGRIRSCGACLVWVFYDISVAELWHSMSAINWWLIALAVFFDIVSYVCQGYRWQLLLRSVGPVSTQQATQAIYAGLFFNEILPLRIGEVVRAFLIARWRSVKFLSIIPSIAVERLFDALWLFAGIGRYGALYTVARGCCECGTNACAGGADTGSTGAVSDILGTE